MANLYSLQVEKHALAGLMRNPEVFADVDRFVSDRDFYVDVHQTIFNCIKNTILSNEKVDKVLLAQKIKNLGISFKGDINIFDYIDSLSFVPVSAEATATSYQELVKLRAFRELSENSEKIKAHIEKNMNESLQKVVSDIDSIYGSKINAFEFDEKPENLFEDVYEMIEETGNNPTDDSGLATPYPEFNRLYGGFREKNLYAIAARPGQGKTTWLNYTANETGKINKCPVLILDTEMSTKEIKFRNAAAMSGVPLWYLETGNWRKNKDYIDKVRKTLKDAVKNNGYRSYHYHVKNKNIDEICSIVRRWYLSVVGRGNKCIIVYDYIKLTGEKIGQNWAEHQAIGDKVDKLKKLSEEVNAPILTAIQINRTGENSNRDSREVTDDSSVIALSDRLQWFASFVAIFRRKTADEMTLDTPDSGTHKLIPTKTRYQGRDAAGHQDLMQRTFPDGSRKLVGNYVSFSVQNFAVQERGSLRDAIARQNAQFQLSDRNVRQAVDDATL